jgi:hypothetical protein
MALSQYVDDRQATVSVPEPREGPAVGLRILANLGRTHDRLAGHAGGRGERVVPRAGPCHRGVRLDPFDVLTLRTVVERDAYLQAQKGRPLNHALADDEHPKGCMSPEAYTWVSNQARAERRCAAKAGQRA